MQFFTISRTLPLTFPSLIGFWNSPSKSEKSICEGNLIKYKVNPDFLESRIKILEEIKYDNHHGIENADVIISGGLGLGKKEAFILLEELADELNGVIAASRPTVDAGWADNSIQVGMSGRVVQP